MANNQTSRNYVKDESIEFPLFQLSPLLVRSPPVTHGISECTLAQPATERKRNNGRGWTSGQERERKRHANACFTPLSTKCKLNNFCVYEICAMRIICCVRRVSVGSFVSCLSQSQSQSQSQLSRYKNQTDYLPSSSKSNTKQRRHKNKRKRQQQQQQQLKWKKKKKKPSDEWNALKRNVNKCENAIERKKNQHIWPNRKLRVGFCVSVCVFCFMIWLSLFLAFVEFFYQRYFRVIVME